MLNPNETNRERLLRLIDGGPEVVKEVQEERKPAAEGKPAVVTPVTQVPPVKKTDPLEAAAKRLALVRWDAATVAKIAVVLFLLVLTLRSAFDLVKEFKKPAASSAVLTTAASAAVPADDSGIGLRLVGVDWGDPPVALLEDLKTGKTYFAHKNEKIKEARVKEIFKNKVTVVFGGKTVELR